MSLKARLMTGSFFLHRAGFRLGHSAQRKDLQGYGPRLCLVTVQVIQLIMGWEATRPICSAVTRHTCACFSSAGALLAL